MNDYTAMAGLMAIFGIFFVFIAGIALVTYILSAIGLYTMAVNRNIENPWLAWIPIVQLYIVGKLIGELKVINYDVPQPEIVLPISAIVAAVGSGIPVIGFFITIACTVIYFFALYRLFYLYKPDKAQLYIILSIVLPFMGPVFMFMLRNEKANVEIV